MNEWQEVPYPSSRRLTFDLGQNSLARHHVRALLEVDVTEARRRVRLAKKTGEHISFFAWLIKCTGDCVAAHPEVNGFNCERRNTTALFKDVDIAIAVEKNVGGKLVPLPYVVRRSNEKGIDQILAEIEAAKAQDIRDEQDYVLGERYNAVATKLFVALPQWLRLVLTRAFFFSNPRLMKNAMGTVMITTVGMAGHARGWIIPFSMHPLCLAFGSLSEQAAVHKGAIERREILHLTVLIDHDVVDGMPAARFVDDLVRRLECGTGLLPR